MHLILILEEFFKLKTIKIKYYNNGDYGDRWLDMIAVDDENKIVTIKAWE